MDPTNPKRLALLLDALASTGARDVLDAGCGKGHFVKELVGAGYSVVGVDVSEAALSHARKANPGCVFHQRPLDLPPWPFADESFDAVWAGEVVEHLFGIGEFFQEAHRVLRPNGLLILTTPYHGLLKNLAIVFWSFDNHFNDFDGGHIRFFTYRLLRRLAGRAGFRSKRCVRIGRVPPLARTMFVVCEKEGPGPER